MKAEEARAYETKYLKIANETDPPGDAIYYSHAQLYGQYAELLERDAEREAKIERVREYADAQGWISGTQHLWAREILAILDAPCETCGGSGDITVPFWMWWALLDYAKGRECKDHEDGCVNSGLCITEWCTPCAAEVFFSEIRHEPISDDEDCGGGRT